MRILSPEDRIARWQSAIGRRSPCGPLYRPPRTVRAVFALTRAAMLRRHIVMPPRSRCRLYHRLTHNVLSRSATRVHRGPEMGDAPGVDSTERAERSVLVQRTD